MYYRCGHESAVTDSSPETGEVSQSDGGVDKTDFRFPFSPFRLSHATCHTKRSCNGREDGDYDVEDLAPSAVVVECSHSGRIFNGIELIYQGLVSVCKDTAQILRFAR